MLRISTTYEISFDISDTDESICTIIRREGSSLNYVKTITGRAAEELFEKIMTNGGK